MKKVIVRTIVVILVLLVLIVGGAWAMIDSLAKSGIEQGGQYALGVGTDVKDVQISLLNGSTQIDGLKIANPPGFASPHLVSTGLFSLQVRPASVIASPVEVTSFVLDGMDLNIELVGGRNNVSVVLDHVQKLGGEKKQPDADEGPGRKVRVDRLEIRNVVAHFHLAPGRKPLTIKVPAIEMTNLSSDNPDGATIGTLVARIFPAVMAAVVQQGGGVIPGDLNKVLNQDIAASAGAMGQQAAKMLQQASADAAAIFKSNADKAAQDLGAPLRGLFDTNKSKSTESDK